MWQSIELLDAFLIFKFSLKMRICEEFYLNLYIGTKFDFFVRERFQKKSREKYGLLPNPGGGSARVVKNQTAFLKKVFFRDYLESF